MRQDAPSRSDVIGFGEKVELFLRILFFDSVSFAPFRCRLLQPKRNIGQLKESSFIGWVAPKDVLPYMFRAFDLRVVFRRGPKVFCVQVPVFPALLWHALLWFGPEPTTILA